MEVGPITASYVRRMAALREQAVRDGASGDDQVRAEAVPHAPAA